MDLTALRRAYESCPCGRPHRLNVRAIEIGRGNTRSAGRILEKNGFPKRILLVADGNTIRAADGIGSGLNRFDVGRQIYDKLEIATMEEVERIQTLSAGYDGVLSVGTGTLNDICRLACSREGKPFAIFATAPSMDGFASYSAPIVSGGFKETHPAKQPEIIIADTRVLAAAPARLKSAGFGDMIAKYIAIADWKISAALSGEYYCERVCALTKEAVEKVSRLSARVTSRDEDTAAEIMNALILTGIAMGFTENSRPASGTEHILAHYWELKKLERGIPLDYHGESVGIATLIVNRIYHKLAGARNVRFHTERLDWPHIYAVYGERMRGDVERLNSPTITDGLDPRALEARWEEVTAVLDELPSDAQMLDWMREAGCVTELSQVFIPPDLVAEGVRFHPFMRHRLSLLRLLPMMAVPSSERAIC